MNIRQQRKLSAKIDAAMKDLPKAPRQPVVIAPKIIVRETPKEAIAAPQKVNEPIPEPIKHIFRKYPCAPSRIF